MKRKPVEGGSNSRKRGANSNQGGNLPNGLGGDHDHRDLTIQEYYESEEILKVHFTGYYLFASLSLLIGIVSDFFQCFICQIRLKILEIKWWKHEWIGE